MKKLLSVFVFIFAIGVCSCFFTACDGPIISAKFNQNEIVLELGETYNPYDFIEGTIDQATKDKISFKFATNDVAFATSKINPSTNKLEQKLVAVSSGNTTLYVYYNDKELASVNVKVPKPKIQLTKPVNLHYDATQGALVWNNVYYEDEGKFKTVTNYTLELKINNTQLDPKTIINQNFYEVSEFGVYTAVVKTVAPSTLEFVVPANSDYTTEDEYHFCIMAKPVDLQYNDTTKTLTWDSNGNPNDTKYQVTYTLKGQEEKTVEVATNEFDIPQNEVVLEGEHTFKVTTVPKDDSYFKNESDVLKVEKLPTPVLTFNNGEVSWSANDKASSYFVQIWKYEEDEWKSVKSEELPGQTELKDVTSSLPYRVCKDAGLYQVSVLMKGDEENLIYDSFESLKYDFEKLAVPQVEFVPSSKTFVIINENQGTVELKLKRNSSVILNDISSTKQFNVTDSDEYSITAQIKTKKPAEQIESEVVTTFNVGDNKDLTTIRNLPIGSLGYSENEGNSCVTYVPNDLGCEYTLFIDNEEFEGVAIDNVFSLGTTVNFFENIPQHNLKLNVSKESANNTFFVDSCFEIHVKQLDAPKFLTLEGDTVKVVTDLQSTIDYEIGTERVEYKISADEGNFVEIDVLNLISANKWEIETRFLAKATTDGINYYSSSPVTTFHIQKLSAPQLSFNYLTNTLDFGEDQNETALEIVGYNIYKGDNLLEQQENPLEQPVTESLIVLDNDVLGEIKVEALANEWQPISASTVGYLNSNKSSCYIYKVGDIKNLRLEKDANEIITAKWDAPEQMFPNNKTKDVEYLITVNDVVVFGGNKVTDTQFKFDKNLFNDVGEYTIKVQVTSPHDDFYPTETSKLVKLTKLPAPETFTRNGNNLQVKKEEYNNSTMQGLKVQIDENEANIYDSNNFTFEVADEQKLAIKVSVVGRFENNNYNLSSAYSENFYIQRLSTVKNLRFEGFIDSTQLSFRWEANETGTSGISFHRYVKKVVDGVEAGEPLDITDTKATDYVYKTFSPNEIVLHVQEISTMDSGSVNITKNSTLVLSSTKETTLKVCQEVVSNVKIEITDAEIIAYWNYIPQLDSEKQKFEVKLTKGNQEKSTIVKEVALWGMGENEICDGTNNKYGVKYTVSNFEEVGDYKVYVKANSDRTFESAEEYAIITRLNQVETLTIYENENIGTFAYENGDITFPETSKLIFDNLDLTNAYNTLIQAGSSLSNIDFSNISSKTEFTVRHQAPNYNIVSPAQKDGHDQYFLDSEKSTFCVDRLPEISISYDNENDKLVWEDVIHDAIKDKATYSLHIESALGGFYDYPFPGNTENFTAHSLNMSDTMLTLIGIAGKNYIKIRTIVKERTIGVYDSPSAPIGYLSSDYGNVLEVEKLQSPSNLSLTTNNDDKTKLTLSWTDSNPLVEEGKLFNIYITGQSKISTTTTSIDLQKSWFENGTTIVQIEAVAKGKITSDRSSKITCVKLDPVINGGVDPDSILSWDKPNQIKENLLSVADSFKGYFIEVFNNGIPKYSPEDPTSDSNFNLLDNVSFLENFEGEFTIKITVLGSEEKENTEQTKNGIFTLTSAPYEITATKLTTPTIRVENNCIVVESNENDVKYFVTISGVYNNYYSAPIPIENNSSPNFEVTAYATSTAGNKINSNITTATVSKLATPSNLRAQADTTQKNVTLTWSEVANAEGYNIYINGAFNATTNETSYVFENAFLDAGTYNIQVQAITENTKLYSDLSTSLRIERLQPMLMTNTYISSEGIVYFTNTDQKDENFKISTFLDLTSEKVLMENTKTSYDGYITNLNNFDGGSFAIKIQYVGSGTTDDKNVCTLSSAERTINGFKLFKPEITITPDKTEIKNINNETLIDISQNRLTINHNEDFAQNEDGTAIENLPKNQFDYPNNWDEGVYKFYAQTIPNTGVVNVLPSNVSNKNTTRLEAPSGLSFNRIEATESYYTDSGAIDENKIGDRLQFNFVGAENAKEYYAFNGQTYYLNKILQKSKVVAGGLDFSQSLEIGSDFEKFLYRGNEITLTSIANDGGNYINSQSTTLQFEVLKSISASDFKTDGYNIIWPATQSIQGFVMQVIKDGSPLYWQTSNTNQNKTQLLHLGHNQGNLSLNIKAMGNITNESTTQGQTIILDSMYICDEELFIKNQQFTKLPQITTLATSTGFFVFDKVANASNYVAYFDDGNENIQKFNLTNYANIANFKADTQFIGYNEEITKLDTTKTYKVVIVAESDNERTLFSNPSNIIYSKVLNNQNDQLKLVVGENEDLTNKIIYFEVNEKANGVLVHEKSIRDVVSENEEQFVLYLEFEKIDNKFPYYPKILKGGKKEFRFANLGSTFKNNPEQEASTQIHYLTSSYASINQTLFAPDKVDIKIVDGVFRWVRVDNEDGYYVYVNDNLYNGGIYLENELALDDVSGNVKLRIIPVSYGDNKLWGPESYYELVQLIGETTHNNRTFATKLTPPQNLDVNNGALLWADGVSGLNDISDLQDYLTEIFKNPTTANVDALDAYLEGLFTMPLKIYSQYSGFNDLKILVNLTDAKGQDCKITTDAYRFLTLTSTQSSNLNTLCTTLNREINKIFAKLAITKPKEELYKFGNQKFANETEFVYARLALIQKHFNLSDANNKYLKLLTNYTNNQGVWPTVNTLFEEFDNNKTASLQSGVYTMNITQFGNNFDWLTSTTSTNQDIFVPPAPQNLIVISSKNNFFLEFSKVVLNANCYYPIDIKYVLVGEEDDGTRKVLTNIYFENNNKIVFNLTDLIEKDVLTPDITKLFVYVEGAKTTNKYCAENNKYQVVSGLKSRYVNITVLPQLQPEFKDGELVLAKEATNFGFEIKAFVGSTLFGSEVINTTNWIGENSYFLESGENYKISVRSVGSSERTTDNVVLSGKTFTFKAQKLQTPTVNINKFGQFEWTSVANSNGYILYVDDVAQTPEHKTGPVVYESDIDGYKNYKFRMLGTITGSIEKNAEGYYINSMVHNSQSGISGAGYNAVMLSKIEEIFVEDGLLKWTPIDITFEQNVPYDKNNWVDGYKVIIDDNLVLYTSELSGDVFKNADALGKKQLDLTNVLDAHGTHKVVIQPYLFVKADNTWQNSVTQVSQGQVVSGMYYQILGKKCEDEVTKIDQPFNIKIVDGELVWEGNENDVRYDYQIYKNGSYDSEGSVDEAKLWSEDILVGAKYTFKVRAYQENCLFSNYATMTTVFGEPVEFEKLPFALPTISYITENAENYITFKLNKIGQAFGINVKYSVNTPDDYKILKCYDDKYKQDSESVITFKINVNEIADNIKILYYQLQYVYLGETNYVASNFTTELEYKIPSAPEAVFFDEQSSEFCFEAERIKTGYSIKDEILNENDELVATYYYTIPDQSFEKLQQQNYFKVRKIGENLIDTISFSPVVMGYKHKVSVAKTSSSAEQNVAKISDYTTCEYIYTESLFKAEYDLFKADSELYKILTLNDFTNYLNNNIYGTENNPYLIGSAEDFAKLNVRLNKYSYLSAFTIFVENTPFNNVEIALSNSSNFHFKQTQNIEGVDFVIGTREKADIAIQYVGFSNTYDGQNFKITYQLTPTELSDKFGLFRIVETGGVIKNLVIDGTINYTNVQQLGGLTAENNGTLENITIQNLKVNNFEILPPTLKLFEFGGVVATNNSTGRLIKVINNSTESLNALVVANEVELSVGGLVAQNKGVVQQSGNNMNITASGTSTIWVGGVAGKNFGDIKQSYNKSQISAISTVMASKVYVGGVVGYNDKVIDSVYALGSVSSSISNGFNVYAGGLVGYSENKDIKNSYSGVGDIKDDNLTIYGGTLVGKVNTNASSDNQNFYILGTQPFGDATTGVFGTPKDMTEANAFKNLVDALNQLTNSDVFAIMGGNIAFAWELLE